VSPAGYYSAFRIPAYRRRVSRRCIFVGRVNKQAARLSSSSPLRSARATPFPRYIVNDSRRSETLVYARVDLHDAPPASSFVSSALASLFFPRSFCFRFSPRLAFSTVPREGRGRRAAEIDEGPDLVVLFRLRSNSMAGFQLPLKFSRVFTFEIFSGNLVDRLYSRDYISLRCSRSVATTTQLYNYSSEFH